MQLKPENLNIDAISPLSEQVDVQIPKCLKVTDYSQY